MKTFSGNITTVSSRRATENAWNELIKDKEVELIDHKVTAANGYDRLVQTIIYRILNEKK